MIIFNKKIYIRHKYSINVIYAKNVYAFNKGSDTIGKSYEWVHSRSIQNVEFDSSSCYHHIYIDLAQRTYATSNLDAANYRCYCGYNKILPTSQKRGRALY